jgi:hypothetical protein
MHSPPAAFEEDRPMGEESWERLCLAIMKEADPHRLMQLVIKLNSTLQERERGLRRVHLIPRKTSPSEPKAVIEN